MILLELFLSIIFVLISPLLLYQLFLGVLALKAKIKTSFPTERNRTFAIIVPAHNEAKIIAKTIYSLWGVVYPKKLYDLYVIADNCTDDTAGIARGLGVTVLERTNRKETGKGYALRWGFDQILQYKREYDAFIIIDADSLVSGNYLEVMNHYLETGSRVIQSSDLVLPQENNWSIEATRIGFLLYNYVKPLGRKVLKLNMGLRGNGMCFETGVLKAYPWKAWSLTEDLEFGLILILNGIHIDFAPEATVWAQMPMESANAESQRSRWEIGRHQVIRQYTSTFLSASIKKRSFAFFDVFIDLITPPFVNMMILISAILLPVSILSLTGLISWTHLLLWGVLLLLGISYLFLGLYIAKADKVLYKSLLHLPVYVVWKLKVYLHAFRTGKETKWIRTERDGKSS
ncbi:MAG: glycosyltransferase family 2 protein [Bacteroidota bacterium]